MSTLRKPTMRNRTARAGGKKKIRIRMYNVGFGDCFLIRIPTDHGERRMLVDCGYHSSGKGEFSDKDLVAQIKADLDGEQLDVVVATHRHQDHISGFGETELWKDIAVEEVWLPFTANPKAAAEEPALRAWQGLMEAAHGLFDANGNITQNAMDGLAARDPEERAAAEFMLWNARANAPGIENLLTGMKRANGRPSKRRFLPEVRDKYPTKLETPALPGVITHVLGPPTQAELRKNKKVPDSWAFGDGLPTACDDPGIVFSAEWQVPAERQGRKPFMETTLQQIRLFNDDLLYAAKALDGFINGESLVLVLEVGKARLLLTGDAEVGAWTMILGNEEALALAAGATFVKVGHHGSHNATPVVFIREHLAKAVPAVISTQEGPGRYRNGIPLIDLIEAMDAREIPCIRSDKPFDTAHDMFEPEEKGKWVDCSIPC
jgi:beta-lactamase superfamily II metal-dependent hydrolase